MQTKSLNTRLINSDCSEVSRQIFTDEQIYRLEQERIFARRWLYLAHRSELKNVGDYLLANMGETPVIVALGEDQKIHVNINSCAHRGLPVCRHDRGNAKRFICPYHNWSYKLNGDLAAIPQERKMAKTVNKSTLGLARVPRVAEYRGLIFGCLDAEIEDLESYLGDMRFHLDTFFDRFEGGVEVIGPPHKWKLQANWKLPVENQMGDVGHGPFLHSTMIGDPAITEEIEQYGLNSTMKYGHGSSFRLFPKGTDWARIAWGVEGIATSPEDKEYMQYLESLQHNAIKRLGVGGRIKGLTFGVYPNFNFLWSNAAIRVSHPCAANEVEYWTWWVVPCSAPPRIRQLLRMNYTLMFGPAGMLEQEDAEAWTQQYIGSNIKALKNKHYYYGLGMEEESSHDEVPGMTGNCYNELYARGFYQQWHSDVGAGVKSA